MILFIPLGISGLCQRLHLNFDRESLRLASTQDAVPYLFLTMAMADRILGVLGFPFNKGQPRGGTEQAPKALRNAGIIDRLKSLGNNVVDHNNVDLGILPEDNNTEGAKNSEAVGAANKKVRGQRVLILSAIRQQ
ncbi:hypothetical protein RRG08_020392 [Elysia crispata]|uniref:Uncharacterized protein n=1 Tax=Elysia crispata TaxID=231223 RepID=A0AAE1DSK5_9GAST|nr:hypothetical protein RRG08_020392 [Elysia crispata]